MRSKEQDPEHFKTLVNAALEAGATCGNLTKEQHLGDFFNAWDAFLKASALKLVDLNPGIASVLAVKDENEIVRQLLCNASELRRNLLNQQHLSPRVC